MPALSQNELGYDVMVTGRYFCDLVFTGLPEMPRLGYEIWGSGCAIIPGASYIPAIAMHRLGLKVAWPCYFGNDPFSRFVYDQVQREGLNTDLFSECNFPALGVTVSLSFANERAFVTYADAMPEPKYAELIHQLHPKWTLLVSLWQGSKFEDFIRAARQNGTKIFMECQAHQSNLNDTNVRRALQQVDVFSPNADEALLLTGAADIETALADLAALTPLVVIKLGQDGAIARQGDQVVRTPAIKVNALDTTGAGDNFDCGFIYAQTRGYSLEDSLRCANICGGLSTTERGGTASAPSAAALEHWRSSYT